MVTTFPGCCGSATNGAARMAETRTAMAMALHIPAAVDGDRLAGHVLRGVGGEEDDGVCDVARGRHAAQRHFLDVFLAHLLWRPAPLARLLAAESIHARPVHDAGVQRVDVDVVGPRLERDGAREPAQGPLRR